jgi:spermidine synthase
VLLATRSPALAVAMLATVTLLGAVSGQGLLTTRGPEGLRLVTDSPYAEIRVLDRRGLRYFLIDGGVHSIADTVTWESRHNYVAVGELAQDAFARPGRMLLVGLGGGSMAKSFSRRGWQVDAVEIDPEVVRVARRYFGLSPGDARVVQMDGRRFLERSPDRYDLIFLDAFGSSSIPFHLVTRETFALARSRLAADGVLGLNIEAVGWSDELVGRLLATLGTSFRHVIALPIAEPPIKVGNLVLLASDRSIEIPDEVLGDPVSSLADDRLHWWVLQRIHAWDNRFLASAHAGKRYQPYTDDLNPVDLRAEAINRASRRELHEFFGPQGGSW